MKKIHIVGGGIGGLAAGALLGRSGHQVTLFEKNSLVGGRARVWETEGFKFDMGPSWYMMPDVFDKFFKIFDKKTSDFYELEKLKTHYKIFLQNGNVYSILSDMKKNLALFERVEKDGAKKLQQFLKEAEDIYEFVINDLIFYDHQSLRPLLNKKIIANLWRLKLLYSFDTDVKRFFKNPDLQKILEFTTVFLGGSPYNTPAFYTLIAHTDFNLKIWHPIGGIYKIIKALEKLCKENNVTIKTDENVKKIIIENGVATKILTEKGEYSTDVAICNADYHFCETQLLEEKYQTYPQKYWDRKTLSPTAFVIYLGLKKRIENVEHHNFYFDNSWLKHFGEVFKKPNWPDSPSYYVHVPTKTDPSLAPKNNDIFYFLVPVAPGLQDSTEIREKFADQVITHFQDLIGQEIKKNIKIKRIFSHKDFIADYNSYKGTAFGLAHTLTQTAMLRPKNKSRKVKNLYYSGQYTNPGIGMPLCLISAQITANAVNKYES